MSAQSDSGILSKDSPGYFFLKNEDENYFKSYLALVERQGNKAKVFILKKRKETNICGIGRIPWDNIWCSVYLVIKETVLSVLPRI